MNKAIKILALSSAIFLSGCIGPHASFSETMQDNFAFTSADEVPSSEAKCITLTQAFELPSGSTTFSLPAGRYIAKRKNKTGYFYYAPSDIKSSHWIVYPSQEGIYLNNEFNSGNVFGKKPDGYSNRPIRGAVLPSSIFPYIKKGC